MALGLHASKMLASCSAPGISCIAKHQENFAHKAGPAQPQINISEWDVSIFDDYQTPLAHGAKKCRTAQDGVSVHSKANSAVCKILDEL